MERRLKHCNMSTIPKKGRTKTSPQIAGEKSYTLDLNHRWSSYQIALTL